MVCNGITNIIIYIAGDKLYIDLYGKGIISHTNTPDYMLGFIARICDAAYFMHSISCGFIFLMLIIYIM